MYKRTGKPNGRPRIDWSDRDSIIFRVLSAGASFRDAAEHAGVSWDSLSRRREIDPVFAEGLLRARLECKIRCLAIIMKAAETDWRAAAWFLSHHPEYRAEWGDRVDRVDVLAAPEVAPPVIRNPRADRHLAAAIALGGEASLKARPLPSELSA